MEFYFTDRQYNLLGIASTERGRFRIAGEVEAQSTSASTVALTGNLYFAKKDLKDAIRMCVGEGGNYILYQDDRGIGHFMTIQNTQVDNTGCSINFQADDAGNDLKNEIVGAYTATKAMTFAQYFNAFTYDSGWEIGINEIPSNARTLEFTSEQSSYDRMLEVANDFGVKIYYSFEINGLEPVHRYLNVVNVLGADNHLTLRQGTDISQIVSETSTADLHTSIKAYGATPDGASQPLNLVGYKWTDSTGQFVLGSDGILRDTVAVRTWSRLRSNSNPAPKSSHLQMVKTYDAATQAALFQSALADIKTYNHPAINYTVTMARVPAEVSKGDTVYCEDEAQDLYFSATVLEVDKCYSIPTASTLTLGDFKIEHDQTSTRIKQVADQLKTLEQTAHWYPWTRYADDDQGTGISSLPLGKAYMAVVWGKTATPSDDPTDYAGNWVKVVGATGKDGADGQPGPAGADGKTPYFHTAWATADGGTSGFSTTDSAGKSYLGVYTDYNQADSTTASSYSWSLIKGPQGIKGDTGATGPKGDSGAPGSKDVPMTYVQATQPTGSIVKDSTWWVGDSMKTATALKRWDGSTWVPDTIAQAVLNIKELNAININGSVFNGSTFNSTFEKVRPDGAAFTVYGTSTLENGALATTTYRDSDNSLYTTTQVTPVDIGSASYYGGTKVDEALLKEGQLYLGTLYKDSASSDPYWEAGTITADQLLMMQRCGSVLWTGVKSMNSDQTITPSISINKCLTGWLLTWQEYRNGAVTGTGIVNTPLYKNDVIAHSGAGFPVGFVNYDQNAVVKYVYPTTTNIEGNARNGSLNYSKGFVMTKVTAF
jgi:hypothetical protein